MKKFKIMAVLFAVMLSTTGLSVLAGGAHAMQNTEMRSQTESLFIAGGNSLVEAAVHIPDYAFEVADWAETSPKIGAKLTFNAAGESNAIRLAGTYRLQDLENLACFVPLPDEGRAEEFVNFYIVVTSVSEDGASNGDSVTFVYNTARSLNGRSSLSVAARSIGGDHECTQKQYGLMNHNSRYVGRPTKYASGMATEVATKASFSGARAPVTVSYRQTNREDGLHCEAYALGCAIDPQGQVVDEYMFRDMARVSDYEIPEDVSEADRPGYENGLVLDDEVFGGFAEDGRFTVSFYVDQLTDPECAAHFLLFGAAGQDFVNRVYADIDYMGAVGEDVPLPSPLCYGEDNRLVENPDYSVEISDETGNSVASKKEGDIFTFNPVSSGEHTVKYIYGEYEFSLPVFVSDVFYPLVIRDVVERTPGDGYSVYGADYPVRGTVECNLFEETQLPALNIGLYTVENGKRSAEPIKGFTAGDTLNFKTESLPFGEYALVYSAGPDIYGRTTEKTVSFSFDEADRAICEWNGCSESENYYYGVSEPLMVSSRDVTCYDAFLGRDFADLQILLRAPGAAADIEVVDALDLTSYFEQNGKKYGKYTVTYNFSYDYGGSSFSETLTRTINIIDGVFPEIIAYNGEYIRNAQVTQEQGNVKYINCLRGRRYILDSLYAIDKYGETRDLTENIILEIVSPDGGRNIVAEYDPVNFSYTFTEKGDYAFVFSVSDRVNGEENNRTSLIYKITVGDYADFLSLQPDKEYDMTATSQKIELGHFGVTNYYGNFIENVSEVRLEITDANNNTVATFVEGDTFFLEKPGEYNLRFSAEADGTALTFQQRIVVSDDTDPVSALAHAEISAKLGEKVSLQEPNFTDNSGLCNVTVTVTHNGRQVALYENTFVPVETGKYIVEYTATDFAGNVSRVSYVLTISDGNFGNVTIFVVIGAAVVLALVGAVIAVVLIKKKGGKNKENETGEN